MTLAMWRRPLIAQLCLCLMYARCQARTDGCGPSTTAEFLRRQIHDKGYDKDVSPADVNASHVELQMQFELEKLLTVHEQLSQVSLRGFMRTWWTDFRLAYNVDQNCTRVKQFAVPSDTIWIPSFYIYNSIKTKQEMFSGSLTVVYANGTVMHSVALHSTVACDMVFERMPYDSHICSLKIGSYDKPSTEYQLRPRGSAPDEYGACGVGVKGSRMLSTMWFVQEEEDFENPGVRVKKFWSDMDANTDILYLPFQFQRRPGYFVRMVMLPSWLIVIVSYTGGFIDPTYAPARAAMAVIPVLIVRSLQALVYSKLPEISTTVWLIDYLSITMVLCCIWPIQMALVEFALQVEKKRAGNLNKLHKVKEKAKELFKTAQNKGQFVSTLLDEFHPVMNDSDEEPRYISYLSRTATPTARSFPQPSNFGELVNKPKQDYDLHHASSEPVKRFSKRIAYQEPAYAMLDHGSGSSLIGFEKEFRKDLVVNTAHSPLAQNKTTEGDLAVIRFLLQIWEKTCSTQSMANPEMIRKIMASFNIYMTTADAANIMCMFLRDRGLDTPIDENQTKMLFSLFMELLFDIDKYQMAVIPVRWCYKPFSHALPWSRRLDTAMQIGFPFLMFLHNMIMFAAIPYYPDYGKMDWWTQNFESIVAWQ